jgi:hypothetical protein
MLSRLRAHANSTIVKPKPEPVVEPKPEPVVVVDKNDASGKRIGELLSKVSLLNLGKFDKSQTP